jgi:pentapeptide repeat protein
MKGSRGVAANRGTRPEPLSNQHVAGASGQDQFSRTDLPRLSRPDPQQPPATYTAPAQIDIDQPGRLALVGPRKRQSVSNSWAGRTPSADEWRDILEKHWRWLRSEGGEHADLRDADLRGAVLRDAVLRDADLRDADLRDADLSDADVPVVPRLHGQIAELLAAGKGDLDMSNWHICETTHCRAGWAIHLAGPAGYKLEEEVGPAVAGALITIASCPSIKVPNFYADTDVALADIQRLAAEGL